MYDEFWWLFIYVWGYKVQILRFSCLIAKADIIGNKLQRSSFPSAFTRLFHGHWLHLQFLAVILLGKSQVDQVGLGSILDDLLKTFFHTNTVLCGCLHVDSVVCCSKVEDLVSGHFDIQITFATDKVNSALYLEVFDLVQPVRQVVKSGSFAEVEAKKNGIRIYMRNEVLL